MSRLPWLSEPFGMSGLPGLPEQSVRGKLSIVGPAGAAVLCTVLTQHLYSNHGQSELYSEILCWAILPVLFTIASHPSSSSNFSSNLNSNLISNLSSNLSSKFNSVPGSQLPSSSISLWVVAAGVATACCYKAEIGTIGLLVRSPPYLVSPLNHTATNALQPVLTPLLLIFERQLRSRAEPQAPWFFSSLVNTATGAALATAVALFTTVSGWNLGKEFVLSTIPAAALLVVYVALIPRGSTTDSPRFFPRINNVEEDITPLSRRVVVVLVVALGAQGVAFGLPTSTKITPTLFLGSVKALSWYFTIQTVCSHLPPSSHTSDITHRFSRHDTPLGVPPRRWRHSPSCLHATHPRCRPKSSPWRKSWRRSLFSARSSTCSQGKPKQYQDQRCGPSCLSRSSHTWRTSSPADRHDLQCHRASAAPGSTPLRP